MSKIYDCQKTRLNSSDFVFTLSILGIIILCLMNMLLVQPVYAKGIPEEIEVFEEFQPGKGKATGKVTSIKGRGVVVHRNEKAGYRTSAGLPLYPGDTLYTGDDSSMAITLSDQSTMVMTSQTTLTLTKSVYEPAEKVRTGFIQMGMGKVRYMIRKFMDFKNQDFKVKTTTSVVGVRGSDFIIETEPNKTEVTALQNTLLEIYSLADIESEPVLLSDYQKSVIPMDDIATEAENVNPEDVEEMIRDIMIRFDQAQTQEMISPGNTGAFSGAATSRSEDAKPVVQTDAPAADDTGAASVALLPVEVEAIGSQEQALEMMPEIVSPEITEHIETVATEIEEEGQMVTDIIGEEETEKVTEKMNQLIDFPPPPSRN